MNNDEYCFDITQLIKKQKELDKYIEEKHDLYNKMSKTDINKNLKLAMLVELGEFSNTTRCFKIWSNKGMMNREIILEEFVDIIHFLLSFTYKIGIDSISFSYSKNTEINLTDTILNCYSKIIKIDEHDVNVSTIIEIWNSLLLIASKMHFTPDELVNSYNKKNLVNHQRQDDNY